ncbi:hypothetical protein C1H46_016458 [Malus baccata]|uniref:Uncharacterized protein n=1 Tax=Malus baccata TaxID=106549 RepID=A0A540MGV0_MALBA|nr:hypothetical protein C1H46_016458 [Malus baccata]
MGTKERPYSASQRQNWQNIFNALVQLLRSQQSNLETMTADRKVFEDRVRMQEEKWVSAFHLLGDQIRQMKVDLELKEMEGSVEAAKLGWALSMKQQEAYTTKLKLEYSDGELEGFKSWFDLHSNNYTTLKQQCDTLASEKSFAWHQYDLMENDYKTKLKSKNSELEQANAKIQTLLASMEQLQSSNNEKDDKIGILISKVAKMETDSNKFKEEISKLSKDLDLLRNAASTSSTPVLNRCTTRARGKSSAKDKINVTVKKDLSAAQLTHSTKDTKKGNGSSKRKADDVVTISETPKLFSSRFKVPKLKNGS